MKEIIFWFDSHQARNYWLDYAIDCLKQYTVETKHSKLKSWIQFFNLKISFKVNNKGEQDLVGNWDKNQYWVEDLFENDFEEYFFTFVFDNKPFEKK